MFSLWIKRLSLQYNSLSLRQCAATEETLKVPVDAKVKASSCILHGRVGLDCEK